MTAPMLTLDGDAILADGVTIMLVTGSLVYPLITGTIWWPWDDDLSELAWRIENRINSAGLVASMAIRLASENLDAARWETDPATRAPFLREFDRLMQVAAIWRRFIP